MTRIELFIPTADLFNIIVDVIKTNSGAKLVYQRFETNRHKAGFVTIDMSTPIDLATKYNDEDFSLAYISLKGTPSSDQDWSFLDKNEENLIEIAGGRQKKNELEQTVIRVLSKKTKCKKIFTQLLQNIESQCQQGILLNKQVYPKIFYHPNASNLTLWDDLDNKTIEATLLL